MFSAQVRLDFFRVASEGSDFVITWHAGVEEGVERYELTRKTQTSNDQFVQVYAAPPHGTGKDYEYRDTQVYKSAAEQLDYRLEVVYVTGAREVLSTQTVHYTSTAVRRTWGSLKALFQ